jgi:hypothetical protein
MAGTFNTTDIIELYEDTIQPQLGRYLAEKSKLFAVFENQTNKSQDNWIKVVTPNTVRRGSRGESVVARRNAPTYKAFKIQLENMADDYSAVSIPTKSVESCTTESALVDIVTDAAKHMISTMALNLDHKLGSDGGGSRGRVEPSSVSTNTLQLQNADHVYYWYLGMIVQASSDNGKGSSPADVRAGELEVSGINPDGTITFTTNVTTGIPAFDDTGAVTAVDFLFELDDYDNDEERIIQGPKAWNPKTAPAAGDPTWFSVDRSEMVTVYAGSRVLGNGAHVFDVVREALAKVEIGRGMPDTLLVGVTKYAEIEQAIQAKQTFQLATRFPDLTIEGFKFQGLNVIKTPAYDSLESTILKRDKFIIGSIGEVPHPANQDGSMWRMEDGRFAIQGRHESFVQTMMEEPWHACHITW